MTSSIVPGLTMVRGTVLFNTSITHGAAIFSLVPNPDGEWKAWTVVTRSDGLIGYSDKFAPGPVQLRKVI